MAVEQTIQKFMAAAVSPTPVVPPQHQSCPHIVARCIPSHQVIPPNPRLLGYLQIKKRLPYPTLYQHSSAVLNGLDAQECKPPCLRTQPPRSKSWNLRTYNDDVASSNRHILPIVASTPQIILIPSLPTS